MKYHPLEKQEKLKKLQYMVKREIHGFQNICPSQMKLRKVKMKYLQSMEYIVTNKRKILVDIYYTPLKNLGYSSDGKSFKKLGDPEVPTVPYTIKKNYVSVFRVI